ncbi:MAG: hypothetical protein JXJ22_04540 [Bacteroidales bacterium]|nr:hypothetical protein [Bacteroidales bacterium]
MKKFNKPIHKIILLAVTLLIAGQASGQDTLFTPPGYPTGILFQCGLGNYTIKDEYISKEKYSGRLPYFSIGWTKGHDNYVYRLEMTLRNSDEIYNNSVSSEITQFSLNQGFLYPLKKIFLFNKEFYVWLGPSTDFFFNYNKPNIAVSGFDYAQSYAGLFSLGFNVDGIYILSHKFQVESFIRTSALSLGWRTIDNEEDDQSPVKPLTLFSGLNSSFDLGIRYYLLNTLSISVAYKLEFVRISAWEKLLSASDNLVIGLNYRFKK